MHKVPFTPDTDPRFKGLVSTIGPWTIRASVADRTEPSSNVQGCPGSYPCFLLLAGRADRQELDLLVKRRPEHKKLVRWPTTGRPRLLDKGIHLDRADCPRAGLVPALLYTHFRALASSAGKEVLQRRYLLAKKDRKRRLGRRPVRVRKCKTISALRFYL